MPNEDMPHWSPGDDILASQLNKISRVAGRSDRVSNYSDRASGAYTDSFSSQNTPSPQIIRYVRITEVGSPLSTGTVTVIDPTTGAFTDLTTSVDVVASEEWFFCPGDILPCVSQNGVMVPLVPPEPALFIDFTIVSTDCETSGHSEASQNSGDSSSNYAVVSVDSYYGGNSPGSSVTVYDGSGCICNAPAGTSGKAIWEARNCRYKLFFLEQWVDVLTGVCQESSSTGGLGTGAADCCDELLQVVTPIKVLCTGTDYTAIVDDCTGTGETCDPCPGMTEIPIYIRGSVSLDLTAELYEQNDRFIDFRTAPFSLEGMDVGAIQTVVSVTYDCVFEQWTMRAGPGLAISTNCTTGILTVVNSDCDNLCISFTGIQCDGNTYNFFAGSGCSVPSGTGSGGSGINEVQKISKVPTSSLTPWTITLDGVTSGSISASASALQVQTALEAMSNIGAGNVSVTQTVSGTEYYWTVTFTNALGSQNISQMTSTEPTISISTIQNGSP